MATTTTYEKYGIYQNTSSTDVSDPSTLDNLVLETNIPLPVPKPNEVLIRVKAVALNYRDLIVIAHSPLYPVQAAKGLTPCVDGAGIVEQVGSSVTNWKPGDRILILPAGSLTEDTPDAPLDVHTSFGAGSTNGVLSQYLTLNENLVTRFPEHLTFDEAAATISVGASAANALFSTPGISLSPGKIVVTQGTGGVSSTAIQVRLLSLLTSRICQSRVCPLMSWAVVASSIADSVTPLVCICRRLHRYRHLFIRRETENS